MKTRLSIAALAFLLAGCTAFDLINGTSPSRHYERTADEPYGALPRHRLDVYRPRSGRSAEPRPLVVFFYGGGWKDGDKADYEFVASSLTDDGFVVMIPDYRLYPGVRFPAFVEDGAEALAWAMRNARRYGGDPERVVVMGHSAGAHIAALLALDASYLNEAGGDGGGLIGLIGLSGPYDFLPIESGYLTEVFPAPLRSRSQPINFARNGAPATLLIHGGDDETVAPGNSERLAAALREAGVPVTLELYDDVGHARVVATLAPPLQFLASTLEDCTAFIRRVSASQDR